MKSGIPSAPTGRLCVPHLISVRYTYFLKHEVWKDVRKFVKDVNEQENQSSVFFDYMG